MRIVSVTVNYKTGPLCIRALEAVVPQIARLGGRAYVVDNDSQDGSFELLTRTVAERGWTEHVKVLASERNVGFGAGNNLAIREALRQDNRPQYVYLLNPDAQPDPDVLETLVAFMDTHPDVGLAGNRVRHDDGSLRLSAFRFPGVLSELEAGLRLGVASRLLARWRVWAPAPERTGPVDWVSGASVIMRSTMLEEIGLFDETFFLYFEETELCHRARAAGWSTYYVVGCETEHIGQVSTGVRDHSKPRPRFWFDSRRHYFVKRYGRGRLWLANTAFLAAYGLYRVRRRLQRKTDREPPRFVRDFIRYSFF